jgi:3-oxoacid CoA-transferase subunit A
MHKVYETAAAALAGLLFDGMTIAAGGFGLCDIPENRIAAICRIEQRTIRTA